jgi:beta-galactosidase GanA
VNLYKAPYTEDRTDHLEGIYAALVEARILFDYIHEQDLGHERISQYSVLILPNMALMSDVQAAAIRQYAERGGAVLATFQTGLFDETGTPRKDFALGELFGIGKAGEPTRANEKAHESMGGIHLQYIRERGALTEGFKRRRGLRVRSGDSRSCHIATRR